MKIRLKILVLVFQWAFKGWEYHIDIEGEKESQIVKSFTMKATFPDKTEEKTKS